MEQRTTTECLELSKFEVLKNGALRYTRTRVSAETRSTTSRTMPYSRFSISDSKPACRIRVFGTDLN
jgi:hypothetical protein